jgi:hypothetical protein
MLLDGVETEAALEEYHTLVAGLMATATVSWSVVTIWRFAHNSRFCSCLAYSYWPICLDLKD